MIETWTIGFTQKSAERFFGLVRDAKVRRLVDVRLNNTSQLAGFAKARDLEYLLRELCGVEYVHMPELAPTRPLLDAYKKKRCTWEVYAQEFLELMDKRRIETTLHPTDLQGACLLCSEHTPDRCHRRLVLEYLETKWAEVLRPRHLV